MVYNGLHLQWVWLIVNNATNQDHVHLSNIKTTHRTLSKKFRGNTTGKRKDVPKTKQEYPHD